MPDLDTPLHLSMLQAYRKKNRLTVRLRQALKEVFAPTAIYGLQWGDPDLFEPLKFIKQRFVLPYVNPEHHALEIGPGGGRWTRYLLGFGRLYAVDFHEELLGELRKNIHRPNMVFVKNSGTDFPSIPLKSIDYLFSFGTFVHLEAPLIDAHLKNISSIIKPGANVVIQYSDKTKIMAQLNHGFAENSPEQMRQMLLDNGYTIIEEDLTTLWHSSVVRCTI